MKETVAFSSAHVRCGGIPFAAFVVDAAGTVLGRGVNRVREHRDPTAHAGVSRVLFAVDRDEAAAHGFDYRGTCALFTSDPLDWRSPVASNLIVPERLHPFEAFRQTNTSSPVCSIEQAERAVDQPVERWTAKRP